MAKKAKAKVMQKKPVRSAKAPKAKAKTAQLRKAKASKPKASNAKAAPKRKARGELGGVIEPRAQKFPGAQGAGPSPVAEIDPDLNLEIETSDRLERGEPAEPEAVPPYGAEDEDDMLEKESA